MTVSLARLWRSRVERSPARLAYQHREHGVWTPVTWRQADERVRPIAGGLLQRGVDPGDPVPLLGSTRLDRLSCATAMALVGAVRGPDSPRSDPEDLVALAERGAAWLDDHPTAIDVRIAATPPLSGALEAPNGAIGILTGDVSDADAARAAWGAIRSGARLVLARTGTSLAELLAAEPADVLFATAEAIDGLAADRVPRSVITRTDHLSVESRRKLATAGITVVSAHVNPNVWGDDDPAVWHIG